MRVRKKGNIRVAKSIFKKNKKQDKPRRLQRPFRRFLRRVMSAGFPVLGKIRTVNSYKIFERVRQTHAYERFMVHL